jgi:hypothetical protein
VIRLRATKYDPSNRDIQGRYTLSEFTSSSDVGKKFENYVLSAEDYVIVEDRYAACVRQLLDISQVDSLQIVELEDNRGKTLVDLQVERLRPAQLDMVHDGMVVKGENIYKIVRMALREVIWCKLCGENGVYVHFGYDYYMYIGCNLERTDLGQPPQGMFYEEMGSPYAY